MSHHQDQENLENLQAYCEELYQELLLNTAESEYLINKIKKLRSEAEDIMQDIDQLTLNTP